MSAYADLFRHLLPRGPVWPAQENEAPWWDALLDGLSAEFERVHADAERLLAIWIDIPDEWLEDFERVFGLERAELTDVERRAQVNAKLASNVGLSLSDIQGVADAFAVSAVVEDLQYPLFRMGQGAMGDPIYGYQWAATYTITYDGPTNAVFEAAMRAVIPPNNSIVFIPT